MTLNFKLSLTELWPSGLVLLLLNKSWLSLIIHSLWPPLMFLWIKSLLWSWHFICGDCGVDSGQTLSVTFWGLIYCLFLQFLMSLLFLLLSPLTFRNCTSSKRLSRLWSTQFHLQPPITLRFGRPQPPPTAMSARGCCGGLLVRACAVQNVESNATRNARTCWMQIVYKVRRRPWILGCDVLAHVINHHTLQAEKKKSFPFFHHFNTVF